MKTLDDAMTSMLKAFKSKGFDEEVAATYVEYLEDIPQDLVVTVIDDLIKTNTFPPTIGEIRVECVKRITHPLSEEAALKLVMTTLAGRIPGDQSAPPLSSLLPQLLLDIVNEIGSYNLKNDEKGEASKSFRRLYRDRIKDHIDHLAAMDLVLVESAHIQQGKIRAALSA